MINWKFKVHCDEIRGDNIYTDFKVWCNSQGLSHLKTNEGAFSDWLKQNNIVLTDYQRRYIAENYFGYTVTWNYENNRWEFKRNGSMED